MPKFRVLIPALALAAAVTVLPAVPASASSYVSGYCTTGAFKGGLGVYYSSYNTKIWIIDRTIYKLEPADSSSDLNNVKHTLFGGSSTATLRSTSSALRDGVAHTLFDSGTADSNYLAQKGGSAYVLESVVFDRFGTDPRCTRRFYLP